jgi:hypothetical protein
MMTYNRLNYISQVVAHGNQQRTLFGIVRADLVDPCQDQGPGAELRNSVSKS